MIPAESNFNAIIVLSHSNDDTNQEYRYSLWDYGTLSRGVSSYIVTGDGLRGLAKSVIQLKTHNTYILSLTTHV